MGLVWLLLVLCQVEQNKLGFECGKWMNGAPASGLHTCFVLQGSYN